MTLDPASNHIGRQFFYAIQVNDLPAAADYLTDMVRHHLEQHPDNDLALQVFISAHVVSAFDLAGNLTIDRLEPLERIINSEILRLRTEYLQYGDPVSIFVHHVMQKVNVLCGLDAATASGRMDHVIGYIDNFYHLPDLNVNDLSIRFDISLSHLSRTFRQVTGQKLTDYIHSVRITNAKRLLAETDTPINKIAEMVGYSSSNAFIRAYRTIEGVPPGAYRTHVQQLNSNHQ